MTFTLIFAAIAACGVFLLFFGIGQARRAAGGAEDFQARLAQYGVDPSGASTLAPPQSMRERLNRLFQPAADRLGQGDAKKGKPSLAEQLAKADLKLRTSEFFMIQLGCVVALGLIFLLRFGVSWQPLAAGVAGYFLPGFYVRYRQRKRIKAFK